MMDCRRDCVDVGLVPAPLSAPIKPTAAMETFNEMFYLASYRRLLYLDLAPCCVLTADGKFIALVLIRQVHNVTTRVPSPHHG